MALIFLTAAIARILCVFFVPTVQSYDFATYQEIASNIYNGLGHTLDGVPVAWQGCGYAYVLGCFYKLIGSNDEFYGKMLNVFFSVATLIPAYLIYLKIFDSKKNAIICFSVTAFFPSYVLYVNVLGTEVFFVLLLAIIICAELYIGNLKLLIPIVGVLSGVATLTKPFMLAYPVICAAVMWARTKDIKRSAAYFALVFVAAVAVVSPWAYRNYRQFGRLIPVSYNSGYVLYINNNDTNVTGSWLDVAVVENDYVKGELPSYIDGETKTVKNTPELELLLKDEANKWILQNPLEFIKLGFLRLNTTFFKGANDIKQWAMNGVTLEYTKKPANLYYRDTNLLYSLFDLLVTTVNVCGFLFVSFNIKKYALSFFGKRDVPMGNLLNILFIHISFFAAVDFVYEGQARYAFPVFLFMIPATVFVITSMINRSAGTAEITNRNLEEA